jgi:hypothetical protein
MKKKAGYSNTFIHDLIIDKAEHLAFYFIINGYNDINKISEELYDYITNYSLFSYNETIKYLDENYKEHKHSYNFEIYSTLIFFTNYNYNNITKNNYGTEGHIIKYLIEPNTHIFYEKIKYYIDNFNKNNNNNETTIENFFKKIGTDIAIYKYIYNDSYELNYERNKLSMSENKSSIAKHLKTDFTIAFRDFYYNYQETILNLILNKSKNINSLCDYKLNYNNNNILLQQCYNIYKYKNDIIKINEEDNCIIYTNTVILKFKIHSELYNDNPNEEILNEINKIVNKIKNPV